eukprot:Nitzschia sp. Nitz4//scaffold237_size30108//11060//11902//NITZ4_007992-RA/size30108-processed-gene-0.19-mRNA-1//1//CDS//3329543506//2759//frame0
MTIEDATKTEVADSHHSHPKGVIVEELDGGKKKLSDVVPADLAALLEKKGLRAVYDRFVDKIVHSGKTRNMFGHWKDAEFVTILDLFHHEFTAGGVNVVLCKGQSDKVVKRWLEFIDLEEAKGYVPQFDVQHLSGQHIKTAYSTIEFPYGVAVEELKHWGRARYDISKKTPPMVEEMMKKKGLEDEYHALVDEVIRECEGHWKDWPKEVLINIRNKYEPKFEEKNVVVFIGSIDEYISHGEFGGHIEHFRWIEFVDRDEQPNYYPQRNTKDESDDKCVIS